MVGLSVVGDGEGALVGLLVGLCVVGDDEGAPLGLFVVGDGDGASVDDLVGKLVGGGVGGFVGAGPQLPPKVTESEFSNSPPDATITPSYLTE